MRVKIVLFSIPMRITNSDETTTQVVRTFKPRTFKFNASYKPNLNNQIDYDLFVHATNDSQNRNVVLLS